MPTQLKLADYAEQRIKRLGGEGVLTRADVPKLDRANLKVLALMKDQRWHSAAEIIEASGQREGLRRLRELRDHYRIDRKRVGHDRNFWYRIVPRNTED